MAPGRPRRAAGQQEAEATPATTIAALPDDLLASVFGELSQMDRLRSALVCRRWRAVSERPELLRLVHFQDAPGVHTVARAGSLLRWLRRHCVAVRSIVMWLDNQPDMTPTQELLSVVDRCLVVCGGSLQHLNLSINTDLTVGAWVEAMPRLQTLTLRAGKVTIWASLDSFTALRSLTVWASNLQLRSGVALPPSLTHLSVCKHQATEMPAQVAALTQLRHQLQEVGYFGVSMARLSGTLRIASFDMCEVSDSLGLLTGLETLRVWPMYRDSNGAARRRTAAPYPADGPGAGRPGRCATGAGGPDPAALAVRWGGWRCRRRGSPISPARRPWQRSLRHLAVPIWLAERSVPFLTGAERLQHLGLPQLWPYKGEAMWRWVATHPPLRRVVLQLGEWEVARESAAAAVKRILAARPALEVRIIEWIDRRGPYVFDEFKAQWCTASK